MKLFHLFKLLFDQFLYACVLLEDRIAFQLNQLKLKLNAKFVSTNKELNEPSVLNFLQLLYHF